MGVTPNFSFPYPASTNFVKDGATNIEDLADAVDTSLYTVTSPWITYTPTFTQVLTITKTVNYAKYKQIGKTVIVQIDLTATSGGTGNNEVKVGLPLAALSATNRNTGHGHIYDASTGIVYNISPILTTTTTVRFFYQTAFGWGFSPNIAIAAGDFISLTLTYEAA